MTDIDLIILGTLLGLATCLAFKDEFARLRQPWVMLFASIARF